MVHSDACLFVGGIKKVPSAMNTEGTFSQFVQLIIS